MALSVDDALKKSQQKGTDFKMTPEEAQRFKEALEKEEFRELCVFQCNARYVCVCVCVCVYVCLCVYVCICIRLGDYMKDMADPKNRKVRAVCAHVCACV